MLLDIQETHADGITTVQLTGKLALGRESQRIETIVEELGRRHESKVIFDMIGVDYIDSAGIGLLALAAGKLKEKGGKLVVVALAGGRVSQLLSLTQVNTIVSMCATLDEARAAFA